MKKIVFFDADGTLWYPKKTKGTKHPIWLYQDPKIRNYTNHLMIIPSARSTIKQLKRMKIITVLLSNNPHPPKEAKVIIKHRVQHFNLETLFDEIHATRVHRRSKGEFIVRLLKKRKIPKSKALMVGDSYEWDYKSARAKGIDALLIGSVYEPMTKRIKRTIKELKDIFTYL